MALHLRPVGPLPASVYWARRAAVLGGVLLLLLLLRACAGGGDDAPQAVRATSSPSAGAAAPSAAPSAGAGSGAPAADAAPCPDAALVVNARTTAATYGAGDPVGITVSVRNGGSTACRREVGQAAVEVRVLSGDDRIWSSADCAPGSDRGARTLSPGEVATTVLEWPGTRSRPGCPTGRPDATPGTYRLLVRVGEYEVGGGSFRLTG